MSAHRCPRPRRRVSGAAPDAGFARRLILESLEPRWLLNGQAPLPDAYGWTVSLGGSGFEAAAALERDSGGNLYAAGFFPNSVNFDQDGGWDGDWDDDGERIFARAPLVAGSNKLRFDVPAWATPTERDRPALARFRFSSVKDLGYGGLAPEGEGEVEDDGLEIVEARGEVSGRVFGDIDGDGILDAGDLGLDGWRIELIDPSTRRLLGVTESASRDLDGDGKIQPETETGWYFFTGVPIGEFEVRQLAPLPSAPAAGDHGEEGAGGGVSGETAVGQSDGQQLQQPQVVIFNSGLEGISGRVDFPDPVLRGAEAGGWTWTQLLMPGTDAMNGQPGAPALPVFKRLVALPLGVEAKDVVVRIGQGTATTKLHGLRLLPYQPSPEDQAPPASLFDDRPFAYDAAAYASSEPWPSALVYVRPLGIVRGLNVAEVEFIPARCRSGGEELEIAERIEWELKFPVISGQTSPGFLTERDTGPFENAAPLYAAVLNAAAVWEHVLPGGGDATSCGGYEYLILTHPDFRDAAEELAAWKNEQGITTRVVTVGAGTARNTEEEIRDAIRAYYDECEVRPSYVLLLGDTEFIPTWYVEYDSPSEELDQSYASGRWRSLGSYHFAGTPGEGVTLVRQERNRGEPADDGTVADAVRFVNVNTGATIIIDNGDPGFSAVGTWAESPAGNEYNGSALVTTTDDDTAVWRPVLPGEGVYEVSAWYSGESAPGSSGGHDFDARALFVVVGATMGSDLPYAQMGAIPDLIPDLALGRMPVDTLDQALAAVRKSIDYEKNPPWDLGFYQEVSTVGLFQGYRSGDPLGRDRRAFIEESERARNTLRDARYTVERIYAETDDDPGDGNDAPLRYYDGSWLPAELGGGSGFAWNGGSWDVRNALLDGRFLVTYRGHGWNGGWSDPGLFGPEGAVGRTPVIYSITCEAGLFDNETSGSTRAGSGVVRGGVYFAEQMIREPDRGAVAMIATTRVSPTWANNALLRGLLDATWPEHDRGYGRDTSLTRLGDILNYGKQYLLANVGGVYGKEVSTNAALENLFGYHLFGDPTLELWTETPHPYLFAATVGFDFVAKPGDDPSSAPQRATGVRVVGPPEGTRITAWQDDGQQLLPLGRGKVLGGQAHLQFVADPWPDRPILLGASLPGAISSPLVAQSAWRPTTSESGVELVVIDTPTRKQRVDFGNFAPAQVRGTVFDDRDRDGARDLGEPGRDGVTVELLDQATGLVITATSTRSERSDPANEETWEAGRFAFADLLPGKYLVRLQPPAGSLQTSPAAPSEPWIKISESGQVPAAIVFGVHRLDSDGDGVLDAVEDGAAGGDGNQDNVPDRLQAHVVSLPSFTTGRVATLVASAPAKFASAAGTRNPSLADSPTAMMFTDGFYGFRLTGLSPGEAAMVTMLGDASTFNTCYAHEPVEAGQLPEWRTFLARGATGAEMLADRLVMRFVDGARGDGDLEQNGEILFLGAAGVNEHPQPWRNPRGAMDVNDDQRITPADALCLINRINVDQTLALPVPPVPPFLPPSYYDPSGDNFLTSADVIWVINDLNTLGPRVVGSIAGAVAAPQVAAAEVAEGEADLSLAAVSSPAASGLLAGAWSSGAGSGLPTDAIAVGLASRPALAPPPPPRVPGDALRPELPMRRVPDAGEPLASAGWAARLVDELWSDGWDPLLEELAVAVGDPT